MSVVTCITGVFFTNPDRPVHPQDDADIIALCRLYDGSSQIRGGWDAIKNLSPFYGVIYDNWEKIHELFVIMEAEDYLQDHLIPSGAQQDIHFLIKKLSREHRRQTE
jgi:hypothetical protein